MSELYNRVYFHAVRRAMLENETLLKGFMDAVASKYPEDKLELLDSFLTAITDNDLFDLIMAGKRPDAYGNKFDPIYEELLNYANRKNQ